MTCPYETKNEIGENKNKEDVWGKPTSQNNINNYNFLGLRSHNFIVGEFSSSHPSVNSNLNLINPASCYESGRDECSPSKPAGSKLLISPIYEKKTIITNMNNMISPIESSTFSGRGVNCFLFLEEKFEEASKNKAKRKSKNLTENLLTPFQKINFSNENNFDESSDNYIDKILFPRNLTFQECEGNSNLNDASKNKKRLNPKEMKVINLNKESKLFSCHCDKSKCLKKYCECLANGETCGDACKCGNCQNKEEILMTNSDLTKSPMFCNCTKSNCQKQYCECYKNKRKCNFLCRCIHCINKVVVEQIKCPLQEYGVFNLLEHTNISIINNDFKIETYSDQIKVLKKKTHRNSKRLIRINKVHNKKDEKLESPKVKRRIKAVKTPLFSTSCATATAKNELNAIKIKEDEKKRISKRLEMKKYKDQTLYPEEN